MSIYDRLAALGRGAAQGATAGWGDEGFAKILDYLPRQDDGTGIPREYAAGSAEKDYLNTARGADADAEAKYPANFNSGKALGAAPGMLAALPLGGMAAVGAGVGSGAVRGAGESTNNGRELAKDTVRGGALGGMLSAGGNAVQAAPAAAKQAMSKLMQGPPAAPAMVLSEAKAGGRLLNEPPGGPRLLNEPPGGPRLLNEPPGGPRLLNEPPGGSRLIGDKKPQLNFAHGETSNMLPPRPNTADLVSERPSMPPMPPIPKPGKLPKQLTAEEEAILEKRLQQTADNDTARRMAKYGDDAVKIRNTATARPGKKARAR